MSTALLFDGLTNRLKPAVNLVIGSAENYTIAIDVEIALAPANNVNGLFGRNSTRTLYYKVDTNTLTWFLISGTSITVSPTFPLNGRRVILNLSKVGDLHTLTVDSDTGQAFSATAVLYVRGVMARGDETVWNTEGKLHGFDLVCSTDSSLSRTLDLDGADQGAVAVEVLDSTNGALFTGFDMPEDGSVWEEVGSSGSEQAIVIATTEQLSQSQLVTISSLNTINAIVSESLTQSQLSNVLLDNQISTVVTEQKTESSLSAIASISNLTTVITEQLTQSTTANINDAQLIYAVQSEQLTESITVVVTTDGAQDINVVVTEQKTQSQTVIVDDLQQLQVVITEQLTQLINSEAQQALAINAVTTEQISQSVTVSVDESRGIFVSVVETEQLTQAINAGIDITELVNAVITEQLTQYATQQINVDLTVSAVISEQLTQAELINVIEQNIAFQLNIDIDQISLEILTPAYTIESLTPVYTIEHIH